MYMCLLESLLPRKIKAVVLVMNYEFIMRVSRSTVQNRLPLLVRYSIVFSLLIYSSLLEPSTSARLTCGRETEVSEVALV